MSEPRLSVQARTNLLALVAAGSAFFLTSPVQAFQVNPGGECPTGPQPFCTATCVNPALWCAENKPANCSGVAGSHADCPESGCAAWPDDELDNKVICTWQ
jgi:hypothetical protein